MRTSSHILAALIVFAASSTAMNAIATKAATPSTTPAAAQQKVTATKRATCYTENATLTVNFNEKETSAEAAIAYPEAKMKELEASLTQFASDFTLQSMNYSLNKNQYNRNNQNNTSAEWNIRGSFNMQFTSIESAQQALIKTDNSNFTTRLKVHKNKTHRCN